MEVLTSQTSKPVEDSSSSSFFLVQSAGFSASVKDRMDQEKKKKKKNVWTWRYASLNFSHALLLFPYSYSILAFHTPIRFLHVSRIFLICLNLLVQIMLCRNSLVLKLVINKIQTWKEKWNFYGWFVVILLHVYRCNWDTTMGSLIWAPNLMAGPYISLPCCLVKQKLMIFYWI